MFAVRTVSARWTASGQFATKRPPVGGRRSSCGSEGTRARAAPANRWSRASQAAACSRASRRAVCGCGRNDTRTGLRRQETHGTSSRNTPTWRLSGLCLFRCATNLLAPGTREPPSAAERQISPMSSRNCAEGGVRGQTRCAVHVFRPAAHFDPRPASGMLRTSRGCREATSCTRRRDQSARRWAGRGSTRSSWRRSRAGRPSSPEPTEGRRASSRRRDSPRPCVSARL
jgi:hypothetical protein